MKRRVFLSLAPVAAIGIPCEVPNYHSVFYQGEYGKLREQVKFRGVLHTVTGIWRNKDGTVNTTILRNHIKYGLLRDDLYEDVVLKGRA